MGLVGLVLLALPIVWPTSLNADANVWISIGPFSIQPGEFAKILLLLFFAALLVSKRRLFSVTGKSLLGLQFPRMRDMGPLFLVWGLAMVISAAQNVRPGTASLSTVLGMLYIVTERASWVVLGVGLASVGAIACTRCPTKSRPVWRTSWTRSRTSTIGVCSSPVPVWPLLRRDHRQGARRGATRS